MLARVVQTAARGRFVAMVPSTVVVPEINVAFLAGVFHPVGLLGMLAALAVVVMGGLCLAIVRESGSSVDAGRAAAIRALRLAGVASEREDPAAA
jgi:hypothetical protein